MHLSVCYVCTTVAFNLNLFIISLTLIVTIIMFSGDGHVGKQHSVTETFPSLLAIKTMHINIA